MRSTLLPSQKAILAMSRAQYIAHQRDSADSTESPVIPTSRPSLSSEDTYTSDIYDASSIAEKVSIGVCIYRLDRRTSRPAVLLLRRTPRWWHQYMAPSERQRGGDWELPGGKVDDDDYSISTAVERLVREQTGLRVIKIIGMLDQMQWSSDVKDLLWEDEDEIVDDVGEDSTACVDGTSAENHDRRNTSSKCGTTKEDDVTESETEWEDDLVETEDGESDMVQVRVGLEVSLHDNFDNGLGIITDDILQSLHNHCRTHCNKSSRAGSDSSDALGIRFADSSPSSSSSSTVDSDETSRPLPPPKDGYGLADFGHFGRDFTLEPAPLMLRSKKANSSGIRPRSRPLPKPLEIPPPLPALSPLRRRAVHIPQADVGPEPPRKEAAVKPQPSQRPAGRYLDRPLPHIGTCMKPVTSARDHRCRQSQEQQDMQKRIRRLGYIQTAMRSPSEGEEEEIKPDYRPAIPDRVQQRRHVQLNFSVLVDESPDAAPVLPPFLLARKAHKPVALGATGAELRRREEERRGEPPKNEFEHDALDWATFNRVKALPMCEDLKSVVHQGLAWAWEALG